jgi:hypothetical protein
VPWPFFLDQPFAVVQVGEGGHGGAQVVDVA